MDPSSCHSHEVPLAAHSFSSPISATFYSKPVLRPSWPRTPQPSSSPIDRSSIQTTLFTGLLQQGKYREELEAEKSLQAIQAHHSIPTFLDKTTKSHEKVVSLAQPSYALTSCIPSSFSSNQNGPTSYFSCRKNPTVSVYMSRASDAHCSHKSLASSSKNDRTPSPSLTSLLNQQLIWQVARILNETPSGPGTKSPAHVPPRPSGSSKTHAPPKLSKPPDASSGLPVNAAFPPKGLSLLGTPLGPVLEDLSTHKLLKYVSHLT